MIADYRYLEFRWKGSVKHSNYIMRLTLLQEMPDQHYQLVLCRAKSMVAPLTPLKVHFKNIENHAIKALVAPALLTDDP